MDRGAWHAAVHGAAKSQSQLSDRAQTREEAWAVFLLVVVLVLFSMFLEKHGSQMGREESISGFPIAGSPLIGAIKRGIHEEVQVEPQERRNIQVSKMPGD